MTKENVIEFVVVTDEMKAKAKAELMDQLWTMFEGFSDEEITQGAAAEGAVEIDGVWFYTATDFTDGMTGDIDKQLEALCEAALEEIADGQTREEATAEFLRLHPGHC